MRCIDPHALRMVLTHWAQHQQGVCIGPATVQLQVADLNALAELGKVYQDSLALSAQLRNLSSFRLQQDKVLGRGSLAVVQEGEQQGLTAQHGKLCPCRSHVQKNPAKYLYILSVVTDKVSAGKSATNTCLPGSFSCVL